MIRNIWCDNASIFELKSFSAQKNSKQFKDMLKKTFKICNPHSLMKHIEYVRVYKNLKIII